MAFNWKPPPKQLMGRAQQAGMMRRCRSCGSTDMVDSDATGDRACAACGVVQQENSIVSSVQFSESGGSSNVVGQFVSADKGRPSGGGANRARGRFGQNRDSRESTIQNGKKKIIQVLAQLHLKTTLAEAVSRLFALCVTQNYVQGRKTMNIVAACVYIVCRQHHFPIMLIDISDKLAVNVYVLGKTFQKLIKFLNLQTQVPIVDPAMYIKRFAAKLDLGSKTNAVCMTALKIIGSMKRDFLASGRQPAGVCCAALTLATRVNRIERSKEEIRKAVKVCDATVRKRLLEFEATPTSQLTVEELNKLPQTVSFPGVEDEDAAAASFGDGEPASAEGNGKAGGGASAGSAVLVSEVRMDPPAFIANRIRDGRLKMPWSEPMLPDSSRRNAGKAGKGKRVKAGGKQDSVVAGTAAAKRVRQEVPRKGGAKDKRAVTSRKKLSPPKRRVADDTSEEEEEASANGGSSGEEEDKERETVPRRSLPRRKSAAAASKKMSADDHGLDDEESGDGDGGGGGDEDDDSAYSSSSAEEDEDEDEGVRGKDRAGSSKMKGRSKGKGKGKGKGRIPCIGKRKRGASARCEDSEDDEDDEEDEDEDEDDEEDEEDGEEESARLSSKMKIDANTDEGREALTRHVLHIRGVQKGVGKAKAKTRTKRSKVQSEVYSCLESMFDEDEERGLSIARGGDGGGGDSDQSTAATSAEKDKEGDEDGDFALPTGAGRKETERSEPGSSAATPESRTGGGDSSSGGEPGGRGDGGDGDDAGAKDDADGGVEGEGEGEEEEELEWGVYLRTEEDSNRTKKEWEKEHKEWMEDQADKQRLLAEEEGSDSAAAAAKKKRKYNLSALKSSGGTFADVLQTEAAKNKSLKIDHAALQRVMNLDGSLKQVDEDDDAMEEVFEDNLAPPAPSKSGKGQGRGARGKPSWGVNAASVGGPGASARGVADKGAGVARGVSKDEELSLGQAAKPQPGASGVKLPAAVKAPAVVKAPWALAGPDDGGEKAIKDALAALTMGGLAALPGTSTASPAAAGGASTTPMQAAGGKPATVVTPKAATLEPKGTVEEIGEEEGEEEEEEGGKEQRGGVGEAAQAEEDYEDDDDEDDEDDDAMYGEMDDDDDPYGEEA